MYPNIQNITFFRLRKKGKKVGDRANCSYFIKAVFVGDDENDAIDVNLTEDERDRRVIKGINEKDLTPKQRKDRKSLKELLEKESRAKKSKAKKREFKTPEKVVGKKEDKKIQKKIADKKDNKAERIKEFRLAVKDLRELLKDGLITKKQFKKSFDKLNDNLEKGGVIWAKH